MTALVERSTRTAEPRSPAPAGTPLTTTWRAPARYDLLATIGVLRRGGGDPAFRVIGRAVWRAVRTTDGPATVRYERRDDRVLVTAWGPGATRVIALAPALLGADDDVSGFEPRHPLVARLHRSQAGLRLARTGSVLESLVPAILEQQVTSAEAWGAWRRLLLRFGEPAPGPAPRGMRVPPGASGWLAITSWDWHRAGVGPGRARTVRVAAGSADAVERLGAAPPEEAARRLRSLPGVGVWTAAEVAQRSHGASDCVSEGDYHLPGLVGFALTGRRGCDDAGMLDLLEPFRPHRQRVVRLLEFSGAGPARRGPRAPVRDYRGF